MHLTLSLKSSFTPCRLQLPLHSISFTARRAGSGGKPAILLHTTDAGENWERVPLSAKLPGNPILSWRSPETLGARR